MTERRARDFWWEDPVDVGQRGRAARLSALQEGQNILAGRVKYSIVDGGIVQSSVGTCEETHWPMTRALLGLRRTPTSMYRVIIRVNFYRTCKLGLHVFTI